MLTIKQATTPALSLILRQQAEIITFMVNYKLNIKKNLFYFQIYGRKIIASSG
jgi:hypothetical protein